MSSVVAGEAEQFYRQIREEAKVLRTLRDRLSASRARAESPNAAGFGGSYVSSSPRRDRLESSVLGLIETEAATMPMIREMVARQLRARSILYGDGSGSPCLLDFLGPRYADAVRLRFLDGKTWREAGKALGKAGSSASWMCDVAFSIMDENGLIGT